MPFRFEFDSKNKILRTNFDGRVTDEDFEQFYRVAGPKIMASLEFRGAITDFTNVTSMEMTPELARALAWSAPLDQEASRPRIIVAPAASAYGLARIFSSHGEDTRPSLHVVRSLEQAYAILGITNAEFKPIE